MHAAKVGQGGGVDAGAPRRAQAVFQDFNGIGAGHGAHRIHPTAEPGREERANGREIEQAFHQRGVIRHRVHHLDHHPAKAVLAKLRQVDILRFQDTVFGDLGRAPVHRLGHRLGGGAAVGHVELDPEIRIRTAGGVAGR